MADNHSDLNIEPAQKRSVGIQQNCAKKDIEGHYRFAYYYAFWTTQYLTLKPDFHLN